MSFIRYIAICWGAWKALKTDRCAYLTINHPGQPPLFAVFMARDREACRVTQFAIENGFNPDSAERIL